MLSPPPALLLLLQRWPSGLQQSGEEGEERPRYCSGNGQDWEGELEKRVCHVFRQAFLNLTELYQGEAEGKEEAGWV